MLNREKLIPAVAEDWEGIRPRVKRGRHPARYVTLPPPTQTPRPTTSTSVDPPRPVTPQPQPSTSSGHASAPNESQRSDAHERPTPMDVEPISMRTRKRLHHTPDDEEAPAKRRCSDAFTSVLASLSLWHCHSSP